MNTRFFDYKMHAVQSARKLLIGLAEANGRSADSVTEKIMVGVLKLSTKDSELIGSLLTEMKLRTTDVETEEFDECVNLLALAFKNGKRNDYQFFWNMIKESMYCVEAAAEEINGEKINASTVAYHVSNAAKESVGATGLKYASDQLVF